MPEEEPDYDYDTDYDSDVDSDYEYEDEEELTTEENELSYDEINVKYVVPEDYILDTEYSDDYYKFYDLDSKSKDIEVYTQIEFSGVQEYFEDVEKYEYQYYIDQEDDFYKNIKKSELKELKVGEYTFKYMEISYDAGTTLSYKKIFAAYELPDDYSYVVEIEAEGTDIPSDLLKNFCTITLK